MRCWKEKSLSCLGHGGWASHRWWKNGVNWGGQVSTPSQMRAWSNWGAGITPSQVREWSELGGRHHPITDEGVEWTGGQASPHHRWGSGVNWGGRRPPAPGASPFLCAACSFYKESGLVPLVPGRQWKEIMQGKTETDRAGNEQVRGQQLINTYQDFMGWWNTKDVLLSTGEDLGKKHTSCLSCGGGF